MWDVFTSDPCFLRILWSTPRTYLPLSGLSRVLSINCVTFTALCLDTWIFSLPPIAIPPELKRVLLLSTYLLHIRTLFLTICPSFCTFLPKGGWCFTQRHRIFMLWCSHLGWKFTFLFQYVPDPLFFFYYIPHQLQFTFQRWGMYIHRLDIYMLQYYHLG